MLPRASSNFQPIKDFSRITVNDKLNGILLTLWDDTSPLFETYWRSIYDFAFFNWNYKDISKEEAHALFRHRFFGPRLSSPYFEFQDTLEKALSFWETALINTGYRENYPSTIDVLTLPDPAAPGEWINKNNKKLSIAHKEIERYNSTRQKIANALKLANRNKYALQIFQQINELQIYPAELLVRLEKYDRAKTSAEKKEAAKSVRSYVNNFSVIRKKYENLITKTRVLHNPSDYVPDQNHHQHLANGTINSDWMYVFELAMNKVILEKFSD
jgi:hypothetical protein